MTTTLIGWCTHHPVLDATREISKAREITMAEAVAPSHKTWIAVVVVAVVTGSVTADSDNDLDGVRTDSDNQAASYRRYDLH